MARPRLLIVDDEPNMGRSLSILLGDEGRREVECVRSGEEALARLAARDDIDLVLCDLSMPGIDGIEVLRRIRARDAETQVIMMTAYSTVQSAVEAMRLGAHEYLIKPFTDEEVSRAVDSALGGARPSPRARRVREKAPDRLCELVGKSEPMRKLFRLIERAAEAESTVLVAGESGSGKELVARAIHSLSRRRGRPFVAVHCAALSESLLESEIFGHERGAFTGAHKTRIGRLEQADGGTLFLDEVGELSPQVQTKLLRALAERTFERVGGSENIKVDFRLVAATHRDLPRLVSEGRFREDLFYRLNVVPVAVPPLRERPGDVALLAELFLQEKALDNGVPTRTLSPEALALLEAHPFPGNVRELENLIERALVFCDHDVLGPDDLPLQSAPMAPPALESLIGTALQDAWPRLQSVVKALEKQLILRTIASHPTRSNEELAQLLGTSRRILELRLQEFQIKKR
jgi:two-component system, NtrC family, response regulator HydG